MTSYGSIIITTLMYLVVLFAVAYWGDSLGARKVSDNTRATIYALTLSIYLSAWTFYGTIGFTLASGLDFLAPSIAPFLLFLFGAPIIRRLAKISREQRSTSIADFIATRYDKSANVAAVVTLVCIIAAIPYIALQLKAVSLSLDYLFKYTHPESFFKGNAFIVALVLSLFAVSFGTRYLKTTEHQTGMTFAIAFSAVIKLFCFLCVGVLALYLIKDIPQETPFLAFHWADGRGWLSQTASLPDYLMLVALGGVAFLLMPRQFHMLFVENIGDHGIKRACLIFPLYVVLINILIIPLAVAGFYLLRGQLVNPDLMILAIPLNAGTKGILLLTYLGGFSAAIAMVAVESVALAIMVSNHLIMPSLLRHNHEGNFEEKKLGNWVLNVRRLAITSVIFAGYVYYRLLPDQSLVSMGLLSFALISQLAPALGASFLWKRGTAFGAIAGFLIGVMVWFIVPLFSFLFSEALQFRPFSLESLNYGKPAFTAGVFFSLLLNTLFYVVFSLLTPKDQETDLDAIKRPKKQKFSRFGLSVDDLRFAVARYYGAEQAQESFNRYFQSLNQVYDGSRQADEDLFIFVERLLASFIGASSARLALTLLVRKGSVSSRAAQQLLDDASAAIQHSRNVFQRAMDNARQGVMVLDKAMNVTAWNKAYQDIYDLPNEQIALGVSLESICRFNAKRGLYGPGNVDHQTLERVKGYTAQYRFVRQKLEPGGRTIEVRSSRLPDGGVVSTHTDVSDLVVAEEERVRAQELLEKRVQERTEELTRLNEELREAKAEADAANQSKTRFLAAASHDILQPLNAARLYSASMVERDRRMGDITLAENISISLDAVEDILTTLLDISRLDSGASKPEFSSCRLGDMTRLLQKEFEPLAKQKGLDVRFIHSSKCVRSDRRLLRRLIQNLISNAIKYTPSGKVLIGVRHDGAHVRLEVWDTGIGFAESKKRIIFEEFKRLDEGARVAKGLGLGLSIVERIARLMNHPLYLNSIVHKGSVFKLTMAQAPAPPVSHQVIADILPSVGGLSGLNVLVIDNEPSILEGMRVLLSGWGCSIITASGMDEALTALDEQVLPDVIIADYQLDNDESGLQVIEALREKTRIGIPSALLTADRSPEMHTEAATLGALVLNKPLKPAALRALLSRIRSGKQKT